MQYNPTGIASKLYACEIAVGARRINGRRREGQFICHCPAHDDQSPSLSVRDSNGKVLVHCFAGCSPGRRHGGAAAPRAPVR